MKPGKPENIKLEALSFNSLELTYDVNMRMKNFPVGLVQKIEISNEHEPGEWLEHDAVADIKVLTIHGLNVKIGTFEKI